jgi:hypothetical protein
MENIKTEWFITNSTVTESSLTLSKSFNSIEYTVLKFTLKLRRVPTYYFLKIIFPFTIIASITLFTFWLAPDSGEKLTLDITILLSLVFYLQIISDYIPRGFSKIPLLTLFTLTNFFMVFLSCVFTVLVLRLYYKSPMFFSSTKNQLPYFARLVLFKYIAPVLMLRFYFRKQGEFYASKELDNHRNSRALTLSKKNEGKKGITNTKTNNNVDVKQVSVADLNKYATEILKLTSEAVDRGEEEDQASSSPASNVENMSKELLRTLRLLNKCILINHKLNKNEVSNDLNDETDVNSNQKQFSSSLYYEEWKQASLVLDR